jgi:hypothetical protein
MSFIAAPDVHLKPLWEERPSAIPASIQSTIVIDLVRLLVDTFCQSAVKSGTAVKEVLEARGRKRHWLSISYRLRFLLLIPLLSARVQMDPDTLSSVFSTTKPYIRR